MVPNNRAKQKKKNKNVLHKEGKVEVMGMNSKVYGSASLENDLTIPILMSVV